MTRFLLTPAGSSGDVNPFVAVGRELARRGHDVRILTAEPFRSVVEAAGLDFVPVLTAERFQAALSDPDLWHPIRGIRALARLLDRESLERGWRALARLHAPGRTVLVGHMLSFPTRAFEEAHRVPAATLQLAPVAFRTLHGPLLLPPRIDPGLLPHPLRRAFWWGVDAIGIAPAVRPSLDAFLSDHDLPVPRRPFADWVHSPRRVLALFPPWFGPPRADWPSAVRLVGFPLHDGFPDPTLPSWLDRWLSEGPAPVLVTPGSANRQAAHLFDVAARAVARDGRRALFVTAFPDQLPDPLPRGVAALAAAPFSTLFSRCAAVVHHGGIGTTAQAMSAGVPQLIVGRAFDQPDNGARVERLRSGVLYNPRRLRVGAFASRLDRLADDPDVRAGVLAVKNRMVEDAGAIAVGRACDLLEELADPVSG